MKILTAAQTFFYGDLRRRKHQNVLMSSRKAPYIFVRLTKFGDRFSQTDNEEANWRFLRTCLKAPRRTAVLSRVGCPAVYLRPNSEIQSPKLGHYTVPVTDVIKHTKTEISTILRSVCSCEITDAAKAVTVHCQINQGRRHVAMQSAPVQRHALHMLL